MLKLRLSPKAVKIKQIQSTAILTIMFFIFGGIAVFFPVISIIFSIIILIIYFFAVTIIIKNWYNSYSYEITNESINIEKGVFVSKSIVIFRNRIQYSAVIQTPLQRIFNTCTVIFHIAGAVVYLSEIDSADSLLFDK